VEETPGGPKQMRSEQGVKFARQWSKTRFAIKNTWDKRIFVMLSKTGKPILKSGKFSLILEPGETYQGRLI
jgi:hypothetical protein